LSSCNSSADLAFLDSSKYSRSGKRGLEIQLDKELVLLLRALDLEPTEFVGDVTVGKIAGKPSLSGRGNFPTSGNASIQLDDGLHSPVVFLISDVARVPSGEGSFID
jgi:hypothetical protein